jgi:type IV pilus assembly protein PilC
MQATVDRMTLQIPVIGDVIRKATIARWTRTLSTMFAAGVPLVEALDSVGGAAGNVVYKNATKQIQSDVSTGTSLTVAMQNALSSRPWWSRWSPSARNPASSTPC